jgi:hypothetical protein
MLAEYADFYDYSSSYPEGEPEDADSEVRNVKGIKEWKRSILFAVVCFGWHPHTSADKAKMASSPFTLSYSFFSLQSRFSFAYIR